MMLVLRAFIYWMLYMHWDFYGAQVINEICPANCTCKGVLLAHCAGSGLRRQTDFWIKLHPQIEELDVSRNDLEEMPKELSNAFVNIVVLNLSRNRIQKINGAAFSAMWRLTHLDLSHNQIKTFSDMSASSVFIGNSKLVTLDLSHNPLVHLGETYEELLTSASLIELDVSHCQIGYVQGPHSLEYVPKLNVLNISSNPLTRLDRLSSESLTILDISNCQLQLLRADTFVHLQSLKVLCISDNVYLSSHRFKPDAKSLQIFEASRCFLEPDYISEFVNVRHVALSGNRIKEIPAMCFRNNGHMLRLDLSENIIGWIADDAFYGASSLKYFDLSRNSLHVISEYTFTYTPILASLNLSRNSLTAMTLLRAPSVRILDVSHCEIKSLHPSFINVLSSVRMLNLSYNHIERLPENSSSYMLSELDLSYCRITAVTKDQISNLRSLEMIDLTGNRLVHIRNNTFGENQYIRRIGLSDNPWRCDCLEENFKSLFLYLTFQERIFDPEQLTCLSPPNVTNRSWREACARDWKPPERKPRNLYLAFFVIVILILSTVFACYVSNKDIMNTTSDDGGCGWYTGWCRRMGCYRRRRRGDEGAAENSATTATTGAGNNGNDSGNTEEIDCRIRESIRTLSQLPSYDEALLLPKRHPSCSKEEQRPEISRGGGGRNRARSEAASTGATKRQSATQTDETMEALLKDIELVRQKTEERARGNVLGGDEEDSQEHKEDDRSSMQEVQYMNLPLPVVQSTEL